MDGPTYFLCCFAALLVGVVCVGIASADYSDGSMPRWARYAIGGLGVLFGAPVLIKLWIYVVLQ